MKNIEDFLKAVSHEKRLRILKMLEIRNLCVCEITDILGIRQPTVSRHLRKLRESGLVEEKRNRLFSEYRLAHRHPLDIVLRLLSEKLDDDPRIKADAEKAKSIDRYEILRRSQG